jgi:hypothetical protein
MHVLDTTRYADGQVTLTEDFDYATVSRALGETWDDPDCSEHDFSHECERTRDVFIWIYGDGENAKDFISRAVVAAWKSHPRLLVCSIKQICGRLGQDEQELNKWNQDFGMQFKESPKFLHNIFLWIYQPPCQDMNGFFCRNLIACWIFIPDLRECSMTTMAKTFAKKKQSLGRWVANVKLTFPELNRLEHFRS